MPDGREPIAVKVQENIGAIAPSEWDACAGIDNPFVRHTFLRALEDSGSVGKESGWLPQHLTIEDETGQLLGAVPMYLKNHSQGEYVFDWGWADAYERAGGRYYPKLQASIPFSPVAGPRLLVRRGDMAMTIKSALVAGLIEVAKQYGVSSLHVTFAEESDASFLESSGFLIRHGHQFHWKNAVYETFDDFLGNLSSRKRKNIRKERRKVDEAGIRVQTLNGPDIKASHWDEFHRF